MSLTRLARRHSFQTLEPFSARDLSVDRNPIELGPCFTPSGQGHNYEIEAYFEGPVEKHSGMIVNLAEVDSLLARVLSPLNGQALSVAISEFMGEKPSVEDLASYVAQSMIREMKFSTPGVRLVKVRLYESEDLWVDVWP